MSIDRQNRDAAADALAAFLRGEISKEGLQERLAAIQADVGQDKYLDYILAYLGDDLYQDIVPRSERGWELLTRELAFLKSDLEWTPQNPSGEDADLPRQIRLARWHVLVLSASVGLGFLVGWWLPGFCLVVSFVSYSASMYRYDAAEDERLAKETAFSPFACEEAWLAHRHCLEAYRLPRYDPAAYATADSLSPWRPLWWRVGFSLGIVMLGLVFAVMYAFSLLIWPLWLVLMALCPLVAYRHVNKRVSD